VKKIKPSFSQRLNAQTEELRLDNTLVVKPYKVPAVVSGKDITSEAALTKLMWVIGNYPHQERRDILSQSIRGEMT
jgi:hypothetical protein